MNTKKYLFPILCLILTSIIGSHISAQNNKPLINNNFYKEFVTKDTLFKSPYIDIDEFRDVPVKHRYIHGGFKGTNARFSFYFPLIENYKGRFFQYITPAPDNETVSQGASGEEDKIGFSLTHGSYFIETNEGGKTDYSSSEFRDPTLAAYRVNAASAQFSRLVAEHIYGEKRPYGYAFGGSGGAYRTVGGFESTQGVWDGVVPYVMGSPVAIPNDFTVRMHAMRILKDKFPQIIDALEPGSRVDMYAFLNQEEKEALTEVTKMGFPPQSWYGYKTMGIHGFLVLYQGVVAADKKYFTEDFWNTKGYLGADPPASLLKSRIQKTSKIKEILTKDKAISTGLYEQMSSTERGTADAAWKALNLQENSVPVALQLEDILPDVNFLGGDLIVKSGAATGKIIQISKLLGDKIIFGPSNPNELLMLKPGDEVQVDNSNFLAVQTYHRHQDPGKEYYVWDQFRDKNGSPVYPQRPVLLGPLFTMGAAGIIPTGKFNGKMILLESLWDREAFPWQADWYRSRVKENLGNKTDDYFRLWYTDHALHSDISIEDDPTHAISYLGILQQALLDLSDWVEKGIAPAPTTKYNIVEGQVVIPSNAIERKGIQPTVVLLANGTKRAEVKAGMPVSLSAIVEVPKGMGKVVASAWNFEEFKNQDIKKSGWDFETSDVYPEKGVIESLNGEEPKVRIKTTHSFSEPGTYFVTIRVATQRNGDAKTSFTRIQNLDRVRVVVSK